MGVNVIIFAGAPDQSHLDWASLDLINHLLTPFTHFIEYGLRGVQTDVRLHHEASNVASSVVQESPFPSIAVWRCLRPLGEHLPTGFTQHHNLNFTDRFQGSDDFFRISALAYGEDQSVLGVHTQADLMASQQQLADFCDKSLAVHEDVQSSQIVPLGNDTSHIGIDEDISGFQEETTFVSVDATSFITETSLDETSYLSVSGSAHLRPIAISSILTDLDKLPPASHLVSIEPQTMTVNLVVGIISIAAPRTVQTRWGDSRTLVELLVGDEIKAGFAITFWLNQGDDGVGNMLAGLRSQDVVLMHNVALNVFTKKVHGHSLRRDLTKVTLLYRTKLGRKDVGGYYSAKQIQSGAAADTQLLKARKVRAWPLINFVGRSIGATTRKGTLGKRATRPWDQPPPLDTQD